MCLQSHSSSHADPAVAAAAVFPEGGAAMERSLPTARRRLLGLAMLGTIALVLGLCLAKYRGAFTSSADVVLHADRAGSTLLPGSDVKMRGVIVGSVRDISSDGSGITAHLSLQPDKISAIPAGVSARMVPKTLFGERYVDLIRPVAGPGGHIRAGDVINQDRSRESIELDKAIGDLMPVLQAVRPQDLAATLNALSQALDGRGAQLGETVTRLDAYVHELNPEIPNLQANFRELAGVADLYNDAAPDLLQALSNLATTSRDLASHRGDFQALLANVTAASSDSTAFLRANQDSIIRLNQVSRPALDVLAKYAPEYPCITRQLVDVIPAVNQVAGVGTDYPGAHITLEVSVSRGKYLPDETPKFEDKRGPRCYPVPEHAPQYPPDDPPIQDGSRHPAPAREGGGFPVLPAAGPSPTTPSSAAPQAWLPNSPAEQDFVAALLAGSWNTQPQAVPSWASLLVGPLFRGADVTIR